MLNPEVIQIPPMLIQPISRMLCGMTTTFMVFPFLRQNGQTMAEITDNGTSDNDQSKQNWKQKPKET